MIANTSGMQPVRFRDGADGKGSSGSLSRLPLCLALAFAVIGNVFLPYAASGMDSFQNTDPISVFDDDLDDGVDDGRDVEVAEDTPADSSDAYADETERTIATALEARSVARLAYQAERMIHRQEFDAAYEVIAHGLNIDPSYIPLWRMRGMLCVELGRNDDADMALDVCLLLNPDDAEARLLGLINDLRREGLTSRQRMGRLVGDINKMDEDLFAKVVARFMERTDLHEQIPVFLEGWRRSDPKLDKVKEALRYYASGLPGQADTALRAVDSDALPSSLMKSVKTLIAAGLGKNDISDWKVEQGEMVRDGDVFTLIAESKKRAFARHRLSAGWDNVGATVLFPSGRAPQSSLYLRYTSPESYIRLTSVAGILRVQERIPGVGLSTIFECPLNRVDVSGLDVLLKGDRLTLRSGGRKLTDPPLPVSRAIDAGWVALACDNLGGEERTEAVFPIFRPRRFDSDWQRLMEGGPLPLDSGIFADDELTGVVVDVGSYSIDSRRELSAFLLDASSMGVATVGELPPGKYDPELLRRMVGHLPEAISRHIWKAVAIRPEIGCDWAQVAAALDDARRSGMQSVLLLDGDTSNSLAEFTGDLWTDWLVLDAKQPPSNTVNTALAKRFVRGLRRDPDDSSCYIP